MLHDVSPFEVLFNKKPNNSVIKVFCSYCFPCLRAYNKHKMEPRSKECVFLSHASKHCEYICLAMKSLKIYVNRHVVFNEKIFPLQLLDEKHKCYEKPISATLSCF